MLLAYVETITPRLQYIFRFIGHELFESGFNITTDKNYYRAAFGPKLNYSSQEIEENEYFIKSHTLLFEEGLREQDLECFELNYHRAFFVTAGDHTFDIFAASFFLISRYEEWLHNADSGGKPFKAEQSLAFRESFLNFPLVNTWIHEFRVALERKFSEMVFHRKGFRQILTYDINQAYYLKFSAQKQVWSRMLGNLLKGNFRQAQAESRILNGKAEDPYDFFERLDGLHLYCRIKPYFFFNVSQQYINDNKGLQQEISRLVEYYASNFNVGVLWNSRSADDKEWMEVVTEKELQSARHPYYDRATIAYFRKLLKAGVHEDFSMAYESVNGFRASVCSTFYWYDFENETETDLKIHPVCFRDRSAINSGLNAAKAYQQLMGYYNHVKKLNGLLVTSWNNETLGNDPAQNDWKAMFELFMKEQVYWDAYNDKG